MKIRIRNNSLRLRLTQQEVDRFQQVGEVLAAIAFPNGTKLHYILRSGKSGADFQAEFDGTRILVTVPREAGEKWLLPTEVGMEELIPLEGETEPLRLLIEKDFQCLSEREDEDESDNFPNPLAGQK
ncbi:MAG: hypothetical protein WD077_11355 [Bacteroidia bacterium]